MFICALSAEDWCLSVVLLKCGDFSWNKGSWVVIYLVGFLETDLSGCVAPSIWMHLLIPHFMFYGLFNLLF